MNAMPTGPDPSDAAAAPEAASPVSFALLRRLRSRSIQRATDDVGALAVAVGRDQDRRAFAALFAHFAPRIKNWLIHSGSSPGAADDLVQDTFVVFWRKASQFDASKATFAAWLFTITRNLRTDSRRGLAQTWVRLDDSVFEAMSDPSLPSAEDGVSGRERQDGVRRALSSLTAEQRRLLHLNFYEDQSHSAIAAELKMPLGTVKTRIRRAAARLRELLEEHKS